MPEVANHQVVAFTTPQNGDTGNADTIRNNVNTLLAAYNTHDADETIHIQSSVIGGLPTAGTEGRKWITVDGTKIQLWYDDGNDWWEVLSTTFPVENGQPELYDAGNSGASLVINWNNGPVQKVTLTATTTLTFTNALAGASYTLLLQQNGTGGYGVTLTGWDFGDNVPTYNTLANRKNVVSGLYDGTEYLAAYAVAGAT